MGLFEERITEYPAWIQDVVFATDVGKAAVRDHRALNSMVEGSIGWREHHNLLIGFWSLIERFPHFMALNLLKTTFGRNPGVNKARAWLARNLRIEQKHADWFVDWAEATGIDRATLFDAQPLSEMTALSDWCWQVCDRGELATAMAATNYAIEGVTGEWCPRLVESTMYHRLLAENKRDSGLRWLRAHAAYDDEHPWEALNIIAALVGPTPSIGQVNGIQHAIQKTYDLHRLAFDAALDPVTIPATRDVVSRRIHTVARISDAASNGATGMSAASS